MDGREIAAVAGEEHCDQEYRDYGNENGTVQGGRHHYQYDDGCDYYCGVVDVGQTVDQVQYHILY